MSQKYVFIAMSITQIGGSEQYLFNKKKYLEKKGYDVYIFSGLKRNILIEGLKKYESYIIPALMYSPLFYSKKEIYNTISAILNIIGEVCQDIVIETDGIDEAKWGEILAQNIGCKNFLFNVQEQHFYTNQEKEYLRFKLNRHELAGINKGSVEMMLNEKIPEIREDMVFAAYCNNVVDDIANDIIIPPADFTFGSIGRLEKDCVIPVLKGILEYVDSSPSEIFNVIMIGGTTQRTVLERIKTMFRDYKNVNLIITGSIYPIPRLLISKIDIFISTAGAASVSYLEKKPTIKVHPVTGKPAFVMSSETYGKVSMYNEMNDTTINDLIKKIRDNSVKITYQPDLYKSYFERMYAEFDRQLDIVHYESGEDYYDVLGKINSCNSVKDYVYYVLGHLLGGEKMQEVLEWMRMRLQ